MTARPPFRFSLSSLPLATILLIALNLIGFAMEWQQGSIQSLEILQQLGALDVVAILQGEWWRIITANFLHYGWLHLGFNLLGLLVIGIILESYLGASRFLLLYLGSGCSAMALMTGYLWLFNDPYQMVVGASAAILGGFGSLGILYYRSWQRTHSIQACNRLGLFGVVMIFQFLLDLQIPEVSVMSHVFGFAMGLALGLVIVPR